MNGWVCCWMNGRGNFGDMGGWIAPTMAGAGLRGGKGRRGQTEDHPGPEKSREAQFTR